MRYGCYKSICIVNHARKRIYIGRWHSSTFIQLISPFLAFSPSARFPSSKNSPSRCQAYQTPPSPLWNQMLLILLLLFNSHLQILNWSLCTLSHFRWSYIFKSIPMFEESLWRCVHAPYTQPGISLKPTAAAAGCSLFTLGAPAERQLDVCPRIWENTK